MLTDRDLPDFSVEFSHLCGLTPGDRPGGPRRLFGSSSSSRLGRLGDAPSGFSRQCEARHDSRNRAGQPPLQKYPGLPQSIWIENVGLDAGREPGLMKRAPLAG